VLMCSNVQQKTLCLEAAGTVGLRIN